MNKELYNIIGVMSGTSLDGIDLAQIHFSICNDKWSYTIVQAETIAYDIEWINKLKNAVAFSEAELQNLNENYTVLLANVINTFISKNEIDNIDAVCSHGHTILHQPQNGITLQIGNLPDIAGLINQVVVCDFRVQDVALGGQGAPLVPIGDRILFSNFDYCLNLGGFSNISFEQNKKRLAFDISPVNTVLNFYAQVLGYDYDNEGAISRGGKLNVSLFEQLNQLEFYSLPFPKSLGFEYVKTIVLPLMETFEISVEEKLRTFTEHIAFQVSKALKDKKGSLYITGGGAYNDFLIDRIQFYLPTFEIIVPDKKTIEFKEALIFALLGVLKLRNEINVLSSVTGAKHDHSSGKIYFPTTATLPI